MKKMYETPKAEKMEFNYVETIVASNTQEPEQEEKPESVPATHLVPAEFHWPAEWTKKMCIACWF